MKSDKHISPGSEAEILFKKFVDDGTIPNNPKLGAIVYKNVLNFKDENLAEIIESLFGSNGWSNSWRNGILDYHHYHSNTHEVLGIYNGEAEVQLGGEKGKRFKLNAGDVVIIPAGVAHKNLGSSADFACVGAYPGGRSYDMNRGREDREKAISNIQEVPIPEKDPVYGNDGPLMRYWK